MMAIRLMICEMPCIASKAKPIMMSDFAGHCGSPPELNDCSLRRNDSRKNGTEVTIMMIVRGRRKKT